MRDLVELNKPAAVDQIRSRLGGIDKVDSRSKSWQSALVGVMNDNGFKRLGAGNYATVFGSQSYPYVIKIFMKDAAYQRWLKFCFQNKGNPWLPVIKGKVVKFTKVFYAIRLERLSPWAGDSAFMSEYRKWEASTSYRPSDENLSAVFDNFTVNRKLVDIHGENLMSRGKQTVVIDPYYNWFNRSNKMDYEIDPDEVDTSIF